MRNWSVDTQKLQQFPEEYQIWWYEQVLNFGIQKGEKLNRQFLRKNIEKLHVEKDTKDYVKFLLA